jgi:hypothetical protein
MKRDRNLVALALIYAATAAIPISLIVAAPVMREPTGTISATAYFGDER